MSSNNSHITLEQTFVTPLQCEHDIHIIDLALQRTDHSTTLKNSIPVVCTFKSSYSAISLQLMDAMFSLELHKVKHLPPPNPLPYFHINLTQMWHHGECGGSSSSRLPVTNNKLYTTDKADGPTVQDHNMTSCKDGLQHMKQQSNSFSLSVEFWHDF